MYVCMWGQSGGYSESELQEIAVMMAGQVDEIQQLRQEWLGQVDALKEQQTQALKCQVTRDILPHIHTIMPQAGFLDGLCGALQEECAGPLHGGGVRSALRRSQTPCGRASSHGAYIHTYIQYIQG